jgi:glutamine synthetase
MCIKAGITITGVNAEVTPSQWEFQIGVEEVLRVCDELILARYVLAKVTEKYGCGVNYHPKPLAGWNGSGAHINISTRKMRQNGGMEVMDKAINQLSQGHLEDVSHFGEDNHMRLCGKFETSSMENFTYGIGDRGASVRIPRIVASKGCGYFEDRRPASNLNPYTTIHRILNRIL